MASHVQTDRCRDASSERRVTTLDVPLFEETDPSIMVARRSRPEPEVGPVVIAGQGLSQKLPYQGTLLMYNRFPIPVHLTGDRITRTFRT